MTGFWILAALTLLVAYALFAPALLGKIRRSPVDRQKLNLMLHRQRRAELEGEFSGEDLAGVQAELDKDLLGDLAAAENTGTKATDNGRGVLIGALVAAPLLGILLYSQLGRFDLADFHAQPAPQAQATAGIEEMVERLAERLKNEPNDLKGWMLLGRSYQETEQYDKAVDAYRHALGLAPENLDIKAAYAEVLGESRGGTFTGEPAQIVAEILAKNPKHHNALWLAGAAAAQGGNPEQAIAYLETLRAEFPKGGQDDQHLSKLIAQLKGEPLDEVAEPVAAGAEAGGEAKSIRVKVDLAETLKAKANPEDTVFIFARAASGPPMPLAIVRKKAKELPLEVTLDDSMAMAPGMNLSAFDQLVIGARISKTGQALPQPGDLQGLTEPKAVENGGSYTVEIREEVK